MAIEKKSLISTLKTTKKANVASSTVAHEGAPTMTTFAAKRPVKSAVKAHSKVVSKKMSSKVVSKKMGSKVVSKLRK